MAQAFADPFSALSRGIESGVGLGLAIKRSNVEEDKLEFLKLQGDLETKRGQDEADRDFKLGRLEKAFDFHVKTKNVAGARKTLQGMDELGGTNLAERITDDRMAEFNDKMKLLDKSAPEDQEGLMAEVMQGFPVLSHLAGIRPAAAPKDFTLKPGEKRFVGGKEVAAVPAAPEKGQWKIIKDPDSTTGYSYQNLATPAEIRTGAPAPGEGKGGPQGFKSERDLRKEYLDITKPFRTVRDSFARVQASAKEPSAAGDLALIFNYMKMLDPASVVRESEFAQAAITGAWGERMKAAGQKILEGERLSGAMRGDFTKRAKMLMKRQKAQFDTSKSEYTRLAKSYKMDPGRIIVDIEDPLVDEVEIPENTVEVVNPETGETEIWDLTTEKRIR
jgi:hypothetical protein